MSKNKMFGQIKNAFQSFEIFNFETKLMEKPSFSF